MNLNKEKAVDFYIYSNGVKWELVEGMFNTWTILKMEMLKLKIAHTDEQCKSLSIVLEQEMFTNES